MLVKMVDGKTIELSEKEEENVRAYWDLNDKYPEYVNHCGFDGVNPPSHNMPECKKHHVKLVNAAAEKKLSSLNTLIEMAREDGDGQAEMALLAQRKRIRSYMNPDTSKANTIDDLDQIFPKELRD